MGRKRVSLGRAEALIENLKRELDLTACIIKNAGHLRKTYTIDGTSGAKTVVMTKADYVPGSAIYIKQGDTNGENVIVTLPAVEAGLKYTFISSATGANNPTVQIKALANVMEGVYIVDDATEDISAKGSLTWDAARWIKGTRVECSSDGANWYIRATCLCVDGELTLATVQAYNVN